MIMNGRGKKIGFESIHDSQKHAQDGYAMCKTRRVVVGIRSAIWTMSYPPSAVSSKQSNDRNVYIMDMAVLG